MIAGLMKLAAIGLVGYCASSQAGSVKDKVEQVAALPKRMMTLHELKQIHRLLQYDLVDASSRDIRLAEFCREELKASGRDPSMDYWETPYRLLFHGTLHHEQSAVSLTPHDLDRVVVVSAGSDKKYYSKDDVTSRGDANEEVKLLKQMIDAQAAKAKK